MLGSAIPKRLVFSLTLVGLVSLLMFSDAWLPSEHASAQEGVGVTLTSASSPSTSTFPAGTVVKVGTDVKDENGFVNGTLANDNYAWATTCGSVTASTTVPQTTFTAGTAACTGTISVDAYQDTATTSTVQDMDAITAAGTSVADRTSANGVASSAVTSTAINNGGGYNAAATALTIDGVNATTIKIDDYVKIGSELAKVSLTSGSSTVGITANGSVTTAMKANEGISDTSIDLDTTTGLLVGEYIKVGDSGEIMKIGTVTDGDTLVVTRGVLGTTATALEIDDVIQEVTVGNALNGALGSTSATDLTVDSTANFSAGDFALIGSEIIQITTVEDGTSLNPVVRGMFGTTAATASDDAEVIEVTVTVTILTASRAQHGTTAASMDDDAVVQEVTVGTILNGAISSTSATDITVDSTANFAAGDFAKIGSEIIQITTVEDGTSLNPVVRGMFGTTAATASDNAEVIEATVTVTTLTATRGVHGTTPDAMLDDAVVEEVTVGTILNGAITDAAATSITVDSTANFTAGDYAKIGTEIIKITTVASGTVLNPVVRGQWGTTAATASDNAEVIEVTVVGTLAASDTALLVADGSVFTANDYLEIDSEVVKVNSIAANVLNVSRGQFGTTDTAHAVDATITKQVTASSSGAVEVTSAAAADPVPTYTDPSPVPAIVPDGLTADDVAVIIPSAGGSFTEVGGTASITVPAGAVANGTAAAVGIVSVATSGLPSPPAAASEGAASGTFTFGSSAINVQWYDATGAAQATYSLNKPAEICLPFTQDDLNGAAGGPDGLGVWRHNGTEWVSLNATANVGAGTVCGNASSFSSFALGLDVAAPGAASASGGGVSLPGTGGYSPAVTTLLLALMAGITMVVVGLFTARRVLWARDLS